MTTAITAGHSFWPKCGYGPNMEFLRIFEEKVKNIKNYAKELPELVQLFQGQSVGLKAPKGYALRVTDLDGTVYWGRQEMLDSWADLYLPEPEQMVVIGAIDNFPSLAEGLQLVVLVDSQGRVYVYENEVLHLVAESLTDFFQKGLEFPPINSYEYGAYITPPTEEEYKKIVEKLGLSELDRRVDEFIQEEDEDLEQLLMHLKSS